MIAQTYNLNLIPNGVNVVVDASQYDKGSRTIVFNLYKGSEVFNVPAGSDVYVMGTKLDKTGYEYSCSFTNNQVSFDIEQQMTVLAGKHDAEIRIMKDGYILGTANFVFNIERAGLEDDTVISETELPLVEYIVQLAEEGKIMEKVDDATVGDIAVFDENGQVYDSGVPIGMIKPVYGVRRSLASADSSWERIGDSIGKVANATHDGTAVTNDFDSIYPWSDIKTVNMADDGTINAEIGDANFKFDGSNGEVMTYIPPFYYSRYQKDGYEYIHISKNYFGGAELSEGFYIGRYTTSSGVHSKSGVQSQVSQNITTFRTQATGKGTGWQQLDYHYFLLQMLYLVEYADGNSQSKLGQGNCSTSAQINTGGCDGLGMKSGCLANAGATAVIYRGIENIFSNIWQFVDGLNIKDNVAYICYKPSSYAVDTFSGDYSAVGYTNANTNGDPIKMGCDPDNPMVALPSVVGASTYGDYYWQNTGNRIARVGGSWASGAYGGLFCWHLNNDSGISNTNIGSRLLMILNKCSLFSVALAKKKSQTDGVSRETEKPIDDHKKMKRYDDIFEKIIEIENIEKAIEKASKRKRNRKSVQKVLRREEYYAQIIRDMLINGTYKPSPYLISTIYDGARRKERTIYKPRFFPDQIIHWAIMLQIGDLLKKRFYYYSCASIKGKGTELAFKATVKAMRSKNKYCLKMDIKKFYPSVDKDILKAKFNDVFMDEKLLNLLYVIIDGNETQGSGIPIGNYCSQWFANFYLTDLDNFIKHELKIKYYIRYMDDIVIFHSNKRKLRKCKEAIEEFLRSEHLEIKDNWQIFDTNKRILDFLGYRFYKDHITLRRNNFLRVKRRAKKVYKKGFIPYKDACAMISYDGLIKRSDCFNYIQKYIKPYVSIKRCKKVVSKQTKGERNETNKQYQNQKQIQH